MKKQLLFTTSLLLSSALAFGAGYQLNLQGLRQLAMGGSGTAVPWDASTIFYNPAALSEFDHIQASANVVALMPRVQFVQSSTNQARSQSQVFTPFSVFVGGPLAYKSALNWGVGIYTPFGSGLKWDDNWSGRYIATNTYLQTVFIQPTLSYRINDIISVGAGFVYGVGSVKLNRSLPITDVNGQDATAELTGDAQGIGFNAAIHLRPVEDVQIGVSYRSKVNMRVDRGLAKFTVPNSLQTSFPLSAFSSELPMPSVISLGAGVSVTKDLTIQADLNLVGWSAYKELAFDYNNNTPLLQDSRYNRDYRNTLAIRLGANYDLTDNVAVMLGTAWDPTPVRNGIVTPDLPDANRWIATGGFSFLITERFTVNAAVEYVTSQKRDGSYNDEGFKGVYQTKALNPGLGVTYDF